MRCEADKPKRGPLLLLMLLLLNDENPSTTVIESIISIISIMIIVVLIILAHITAGRCSDTTRTVIDEMTQRQNNPRPTIDENKRIVVD